MITEILIARWQCYKIKMHGIIQDVPKNGPLFKIHSTGQVDFAYNTSGKWVADTQQRELEQFKIISSSYYEIHLSLGNGIVTYYCKRLP